MDKRIFLKAAEMINNGRGGFACHALSDVKFGIDSEYRRDFIELEMFEYMFKPKRASVHWGWFGKVMNPENVDARVNALLFMAELCD